MARAEFKENLETKIQQRRDRSPIELSRAPASDEAKLYLPVNSEGIFDDQHQLYLDNRVVNHQAGYDIYTPLKRADGRAILVKRGWLPQGRTRKDLPDIRIEDSRAIVRGVLARPPSAGLVLSENVNHYEKWPTVVQFIDLNQIEQALGYKLYPLILVLDSDSRYAYHQQPIEFNMTSDKHRGYAFQWFGLATALVIIYFVVNTKRRKKHNES